ncbi:hypothetical protein KCU98_g12066, partial [Aureobasidium melanogenum]
MSCSWQPDVLSRRHVEGLIAEGQTLIILDGHVLKLDAWMSYHPGGHKAIQHVVRHDATDEITALHSAQTRSLMSRFRIGRIDGRWENFTPPSQGGVYRLYSEQDCDQGCDRGGDATFADAATPEVSHPSSIPLANMTNGNNLGARVTTANMTLSLREPLASTSRRLDPRSELLAAHSQREIDFDLSKYPLLDNKTQDDIVEKYRLLNHQIQAEGLYDCNYLAYTWEAARCSALFAGMLLLLHKGWIIASAILLGAFWSQLVFHRTRC